jgi:hypothetical protein
MNPLFDGPQVFAVEDTSAQLTWRRLPCGPVSVRCGSTDAVIESDGGPGVADVEGLNPDREHVAELRAGDRHWRVRFRTLATPPGEEMYRFATMNDLHLGMTSFGVRWKLREPAGIEPHPIRCGRSALDDLQAWGAQRLVVKGDLVHFNSAGNWELARDLLARSTVPWAVLPGNHELAHGDRGAIATARAHGVELVEEVDRIDVPGLRLVLMNSAIEDVDVGRWGHLQAAAVDAVCDTTGPVMLLVHHHPQPAPFPTHIPPGIDSISARRFLSAVRAANPSVLGASGHTHRHRFRNLGGVPWAEVGSTKDFPGAWAGYVVHEGGIRQVVRRVSDPGSLTWLDRTRRVAGGAWALWTPGRLRDRCFTHVWPSTTR